MERVTSRFADYTQAGGNWTKSEYAAELQRYENIMEQCNMKDIQALETLLKANARGLVVVLPFRPEKGKTLIDVTEFVEPRPHSDWYKVDGSEVAISFGKNGEPTYTLDCIDYTADAFGTVIFESESEAWAALEKEKSNE